MNLDLYVILIRSVDNKQWMGNLAMRRDNIATIGSHKETFKSKLAIL